MAEVNIQPKKGNRKLKNVRVDLTPMVDLGFILITFFIFTTSMSEPKSMKLRLPAPTQKDSMQTAESKTLNLVLSTNNKVGYYFGSNISTMRQVNMYEVRKVIQEHKRTVQQQFGDAREQVLLIKPTDFSKYGNLVDVLDEIIINEVGRYVLMEASDQERKIVER